MPEYNLQAAIKAVVDHAKWNGYRREEIAAVLRAEAVVAERG